MRNGDDQQGSFVKIVPLVHPLFGMIASMAADLLGQLVPDVAATMVLEHQMTWQKAQWTARQTLVAKVAQTNLLTWLKLIQCARGRQDWTWARTRARTCHALGSIMPCLMHCSSRAVSRTRSFLPPLSPPTRARPALERVDSGLG